MLKFRYVKWKYREADFTAVPTCFHKLVIAFKKRKKSCVQFFHYCNEDTSKLVNLSCGLVHKINAEYYSDNSEKV